MGAYRQDAAETAGKDASDQASDEPEELKPTDIVMAGSAVISALTSIAVAVFTWRLFVVGRNQHRAAMRSNAISRRSARASVEAANAASLTAKAAIGVELPALAAVNVLPSVHKGTLADKLAWPRLKVVIRNYGRTPAFVLGQALCVVTNVELSDKPDYSSGAVDILPSTLIEGSDSYILDGSRQPRTFTPEEVEDLIQLRRVLYVYGYVHYRDFLREPHMLRFFFEVIPQGNGELRFIELERPGYSDSF